MSDEQDDELARRFKALFNKEPISQTTLEPAWRMKESEDYEVDDEEVSVGDTMLILAWEVG